MSNAAIPTIPGLDLAGAMERLDLSFEEFKELLPVFPDAVRMQTAKLEADAAGGDLTAVRFGAHALAGLAGNYGANALWVAAKALEAAVHGNQPDKVSALLAEIRVLAAQAAAGVEGLLG